MKIDRHNYEEYFLLYVDNELSVDQKQQVESFVRENPDLQVELVMLQQAKLPSDHSLVFEGKESLFREENDSSISLSNYEQWLIAYVDDELSAEERSAVERLALAHPQVGMELNLFLQTKLQPERIIFPDKQALYKGTRVVISMQWWKVAVAAILIIAAGMLTYSIVHTRSNNGLAGTVQPKVKIDPVKPSQSPVQNNGPGKGETAIAAATGHQDAGKPVKKVIDQHVPEPTLVAQNNSHGRTVASEGAPITIQQSQINSSVVSGDKTHKEIINTIPVTNPAVDTPDKNNAPDNGVEYASNTEHKKFRGFFRKATRILEHTTNINAANDDNRVLIGGMAINLK